MDPLEIFMFMLRNSSLVVLAYGAYLCIAHWSVLDGFQEAIRAAGWRNNAVSINGYRNHAGESENDNAMQSQLG
jgi:hypothetical protein